MCRSPRPTLFLLILLVVAACTDRSAAPVRPDALEVGTPFTIFAASSRSQEPDGSFGFRRSDKLSYLELTVSIPPAHHSGDLVFGYADPDPRREFTLARQESFASDKDFLARINQALRQRPAEEREVTLFVPGFNSTQTESAFRGAQMAYDIGVPSLFALYSWPSRGKALSYAYDNDSVLFARDGLEKMLRDMSRTSASRVLLVAHSMGSLLVMETLRQIDQKDPGWPARNLAGVVLISPDLDIQVFRSQVLGLSEVPEPFVLLTSRRDRILNLSARLRGTVVQNRLGNISDESEIADLPIELIDTTAFSGGGADPHFLPATSPALLSILSEARQVGATLGEERVTLSSAITGRTSSSHSAIMIELSPDGVVPR